MEKRTENHIKRIAITGPECSGKTTLTQHLAFHFNTCWVPEYARAYLTIHTQAYTPTDVEKIAQGQIDSEAILLSKASDYLFCDTDLLVIKIWMEVRFNRCPAWINNMLSEKHYNVHLLCKPDLPWVADPLRENPNDRDVLFHLYEQALQELELPYVVIDGIGEQRYRKGLEALTLL